VSGYKLVEEGNVQADYGKTLGLGLDVYCQLDSEQWPYFHVDQQVAMVGYEEAAPTAVGGYELLVGGNARGDGGKALGHRQFARYYKQKYKPGDPRRSSSISSVIAS